MRRSTLILIIGLVVCAGTFFIWTAIAARKKSNDILSKFNEVNNQLKSVNDSIDSQKGIGAVQENLSVAGMNNDIVLLIDSLKQKYEAVSGASQLMATSKQLEPDIKRLLLYIQQANKFKWDMMDSAIPDTIAYWTRPAKFNQDKWLADFFKDQPKEVSITYLNYLKKEAIANNY